MTQSHTACSIVNNLIERLKITVIVCMSFTTVFHTTSTSDVHTDILFDTYDKRLY